MQFPWLAPLAGRIMVLQQAVNLPPRRFDSYPASHFISGEESMAVRKEVVVEEKTVYYFSCDVCNASATGYSSCCQCKRVLCDRCTNASWGSSDYPPRYCPPCWKISEAYQARIDSLEQSHDVVIANVKRECTEECLRAVNKK